MILRKTCASTLGILLLAGLAAPRAVTAQDKPAMVPLKLQLVIGRYNGDKKITSLPYTIMVTANDRNRVTTSVRMGVRVPIASSQTGAKEGAPPPPSYRYEQLGTSIDCTATSTQEGPFHLVMTLNDTSLHNDLKQQPTGPIPAAIAGVPAFRNFTSTFTLLLRDGQTAQYASAADPVTGEVLRVDVTLSVVK